jgi:oligopeptide/dipeptide ABC transporter ATP-binding protein
MPQAMMHSGALEITGLSISVPTPSGPRKAVHDLSLTIEQGETVALVGESGSGKTLTALATMGLLSRVGATQSAGTVRVFDENGFSDASSRRGHSSRRAALIPQEPLAALDPVFPIGAQIVEAVRACDDIGRREAREIAARLLTAVGLPDAATRMKQYPHEFSGGMCQRVLIAMALATRPRLLVADEPTTALDVTVQAQVLQLLRDLSHDHAMGMLLITHDMGVAAQLADRILVMYAGRVVEEGPTSDLLSRARHPYTRDLLAAVPTIAGPLHGLPSVPGRVPAPGEAPAGCPYRPRCARAQNVCSSAWPAASPLADHAVHCNFPIELVASHA